MEQSIYELYMEQVNPQDTREIMQAEDALTALLKLVENRELRDAIDRAAGRVAYLREVVLADVPCDFTLGGDVSDHLEIAIFHHGGVADRNPVAETAKEQLQIPGSHQ